MSPLDPKKLADAAAPKALAKYLAELTPQTMDMGHEHQTGMVETVRQDRYKGHAIEVRTTYQLRVDGQPINTSFMMMNDGSIHCHAMPNYRFVSVPELIRNLIDTFPNEFPVPAGDK